MKFRVFGNYFLILFLLFALVPLDALELRKGWRLVSFPYQNMALQDLNNSKVKTVWGYAKKWSAHSFDGDYSASLLLHDIDNLTNIQTSKGYWLEITQDTNLSFPLKKVSLLNDINITKGWNLIGAISKKSSIYEIDKNALYWKYDNGWKLGANKKYDGFSTFSTFTNFDGVWIHSDKNKTFFEDERYKYLFLDEDLVPQQENSIKEGISTDGFLYSSSPYFNLNTDIQSVKVGQDFVVFLPKMNQTVFDKNSTEPLLAHNFTLDDYFKDFYPIKSIAIEAVPIKPGFLSPEVNMVVSNISMDLSVTLFFNSITKPENFSHGEFIKGVKVTARDIHAEVIDPKEIDTKMQMKPIFNVSSPVLYPYIYAFDGTDWKLIGAGTYRDGKVYSINWYDKFTSYILVDMASSMLYKKEFRVFDTQGEVLRDAYMVSSDKVVAISNYDGNITFKSPVAPTKLAVYKHGYKPKIIDINKTNITLEKSDNFSLLSGVNISYDENLSPIYTIGPRGKYFTYESTLFSIKPELLSDTNYTIYSSVYPYQDGYIFGASDSSVVKIENDGNISTIDSEDGIIYDGFLVADDVVYCGTFGDSFKKLFSFKDDALSDIAFYDYGLSVVYKPLVTISRIFIPLYNQNSETHATLLIKDSDGNNLNLIENRGEAGKIAEDENEVFFGTSDSKIVFVDKSSGSVAKTFDFNGTGIIAKVVELNGYYFAIDLNGTIKKFDSSGKELSSKHLNPSSNLLTKDDSLIVADFNGTIYHLDSDLNIDSFDILDSGIIAQPIIYKDSIYTITEKGTFYKNSYKIGTFKGKVTNINLADNIMLFGCENGSVWKIKL